MPLDATAAPVAVFTMHLPGLADVAEARLQAFFAASDHAPSVQQWAAIRDLLDHLEQAATTGLAPAVYLSAIPAGTGKSASLAAFASALAASPAHRGVGMLIACNRVEEVKAMARDLVAHRNRLAVIVGTDTKNDDARALGDHTTADVAQVVVATQAALKATLKGGVPFDAAARFHYQGARRAVVCWDEAIAFNRPVVLDGDALLGLARAIRRQSPEATGALKRWSLELDATEPGQCSVPDFAALGVDFRRLEDDAGADDDLAAQAHTLGIVSGGTAFVMRDNLAGPTLIGHVPELPPSLMPVIVTDASAARGVHHASYDQMATNRVVVRLQEAEKSYCNLTVRLVPVAASRSAYRDRKGTQARDLIDMAVRYVRTIPETEPVLVVSYKNRMTMKGVAQATVADAINAQLSEPERGRVRHLTWGTHTATNDHRDVRHVLLTGLNFLPGAASYAAAGAALNKAMIADPPGEDHPSPVQVAEMRVGMLRDSTLQAILRGNARKADNGDCGPMDVVVFQTRQTGLSMEDYTGMFPGAAILEDRSLLPPKPLKGKLKTLGAIVARHLRMGETQMRNTDLARALKMDPDNFRRLIQAPAWQQHIASLGLAIGPIDGRSRGLVRG